MFGYVVVLAVGYVLGTKAGRRRYEQIAGTYRAVTESPAAKAVITAGRRKIANRVSPDSEMVTLTPIDAETAVLNRRRRRPLKSVSIGLLIVWPGSNGPVLTPKPFRRAVDAEFGRAGVDRLAVRVAQALAVLFVAEPSEAFARVGLVILGRSGRNHGRGESRSRRGGDRESADSDHPTSSFRSHLLAFHQWAEGVYTLTCGGGLRSKVVAAGLFQQAAAIRLHRDQVAEQRVVLVALLHRRHALQLRFDLGDLAADGHLLQPGEYSTDVARQPVVVLDTDRFHAELVDQARGRLRTGLLAHGLDPFRTRGPVDVPRRRNGRSNRRIPDVKLSTVSASNTGPASAAYCSADFSASRCGHSVGSAGRAGPPPQRPGSAARPAPLSRRAPAATP